jgi:hypothetical protein
MYMKAFGLDLYKDSKFCTIYNGKSYSVLKNSQ